MACLLCNTGKSLQLLLFNCPNFGVHFSTWHLGVACAARYLSPWHAMAAIFFKKM